MCKRERGRRKDSDNIEFEDVGEFIARYVDDFFDALRRGLTGKAKRLKKRVLRRGYASIYGMRRDKSGKTSMVNHLVVNGRGRVRHYGIHGVRGWNHENPDEVQFRNRRGEDVEWEEIGEVKKGGRLRPERTRRWKRAGGKPNKKR